MSKRLNLAMAGVGLAALLGAGWYGYQRVYAGPRDELLKEIAQYRQSAASYERALEGQRAVAERLDRIASTTLGKQFDRLDHRLRTGLSRIGQDAGLTDVVVSSSPPKDERNPLASAKGLDRSLADRIRKSSNFSVVKAQVRGAGTLEQVLGALATYGSQAWIHRIDGLSIRPAGQGRERFELRLDVATIWLPDLAKEDLAEPTIQAPGEADISAIAAIASKNVFRAPVPPRPTPEQRVAAAPPPAGPAAPAWAEWKLTGVTTGRRGTEALMMNTRSGERLAIAPGGGVLGATLVSGAGEEAVFELEGARWTVRTGATLAERVKKE